MKDRERYEIAGKLFARMLSRRRAGETKRLTLGPRQEEVVAFVLDGALQTWDPDYESKQRLSGVRE